MAPPKGFKPSPLSAAGKGRVKGTPNKITTSFRQAVLIAFEGLGGAQGFQEWGKSNQTEFYKIAARLIPTEIVGEGGDGPVKVTVNHIYDEKAE